MSSVGAGGRPSSPGAWRRPSSPGAVRASLWLIPDEAGRAAIAALIDELAHTLDAPPFEPHLTLLGGLEVEEHALREPLERIAAGASPPRLPVLGLGAQDAFYRALFAVVGDSAELRALHERARAAFGAPVRERFPHVSLLYADFEESTKRPLFPMLAPRLPAELRFDRLRAQATAGSPQTWRILYEIHLKPAA